MKTQNYLLLLLIVPMLFAASCKKGDVGPEGPAGINGVDGADGKNGTNGTNGARGPAGPTGATGATGSRGQTGPAGTANVIYSGWVYATNFRDTTADNSKLRLADINAPKLTAALLNTATIQVYMNFGAGVYILPYASYAGGKLNTISFLPRVGKIIATRFTADNSNGVALSTLLQYRYVIIPGGTMAAAKKVNMNDYKAVQKYFNIPD